MKSLKLSCISASLLFLSAERAVAFNFGFVRVPDWMDSYFVWLLVATCAGFLGLAVTKPRGVPFNQLPNTKISPLANFFRFSMLVAVAILMTMIFVGMGLRRFAEA